MPNGVKYSTTTPTGALRKDNVALGVNGNLGPTGTTGFYSMVTPASGKYTINKVSVSGIPNFFTPQNDAELIRFAVSEGATGADTGSVAAVLAWIATQPNLEAANFQYENIVTDGLQLNLDAGFVGSYPTVNTTWYDLSGNVINGTLINSPTFNSAYSGSIVFNAANNFVTTPASNYGITNQFTIEVACYPTTQVNGMFNFLGNVGDRGIMAHWPWSDDYGYLDLNNTDGNFFRWYKISAGIQNVQALYQFILYPSGQVVVKQNNVIMTPSGTDTFSGTVALGVNNTIGAFNQSAGLPWGGNMYLFRVYNRALTDTELTQNFTAVRNRLGI
jgi:hypothetical protein